MFKKLGSLEVTAEPNIRVQRHLGTLQYCEGDRQIVLPVEPGQSADGRKTTVVYFPKPLHWEPPFATEVISNEQTQRIRGHILEALLTIGAVPELADIAVEHIRPD